MYVTSLWQPPGSLWPRTRCVRRGVAQYLAASARTAPRPRTDPWGTRECSPPSLCGTLGSVWCDGKRSRASTPWLASNTHAQPWVRGCPICLPETLFGWMHGGSVCCHRWLRVVGHPLVCPPSPISNCGNVAHTECPRHCTGAAPGGHSTPTLAAAQPRACPWAVGRTPRGRGGHLLVECHFTSRPPPPSLVTQRLPRYHCLLPRARSAAGPVTCERRCAHGWRRASA